MYTNILLFYIINSCTCRVDILCYTLGKVLYNITLPDLQDTWIWDLDISGDTLIVPADDEKTVLFYKLLH